MLDFPNIMHLFFPYFGSKDYPDGKGLPHVHVAKMMIKNNRKLTVGDHIPYVITEPV